jgi:hypothetical protein
VAVSHYNSPFNKDHVVQAAWFFDKATKIKGISPFFFVFDTKMSKYFLYF